MSVPVALITGSRKGIGRALAEHLVEQGWHVVGCARGPAEFVHDQYQHAQLDVSDEAAVKRLLAQVRSSHGRLNALINNAGIAAMNHALLTPMSTVDRILNTNIKGTFLFCREAARLMREARHGRIVNFSSVAVPLNLEGEAIYAASKAAVESLTRILARELAPLGITCNAVGPTPIETDLVRGVPRPKLDALLARQAIPRFGTMADVLHAVNFFLHPSSDFITGQVLYLGGVS